MRPLPLLLSASLLVLSASASARTMPYPDADTPVAGSTVQVTAPAVLIPDRLAEQIRTTYALSNGWRLKVEPFGRHYIDARIDNRRTMRLRAVAEDTFVSRNGKVTMQFNQGESGDDMTLSYVPDARLAQVVVISSRIAQR
jgi:hypothetical protein